MHVSASASSSAWTKVWLYVNGMRTALGLHHADGQRLRTLHAVDAVDQSGDPADQSSRFGRQP